MNHSFRGAVLAAGVTIAVVVSSCASIVGKSDYPVSFNSTPSGANVIVVDEAGREVFNGTTPATATLAAGRGYFKGHDYKVKFAKDGFSSYEAPIKRGTSKWYIFGNIAIGGLIGWLIVDPITGAMWTLDDKIDASLVVQSAAESDEPTLNVVALNDVPASLRQRLRRVN